MEFINFVPKIIGETVRFDWDKETKNKEKRNKEHEEIGKKNWNWDK